MVSEIWVELILALFIAGGGSILITKIIWDWLQNRNLVPQSKNGFITSEQHKELSNGSWETYRQLIRGDVKEIMEPLVKELAEGDFRIRSMDVWLRHHAEEHAEILLSLKKLVKEQDEVRLTLNTHFGEHKSAVERHGEAHDRLLARLEGKKDV